MIHYNSLWETMSNKHFTTYTLREKHNIGHGTVQRLQKNMPVSTYTLDRLCKILDCRLDFEEIGERTPGDFAPWTPAGERVSFPHTPFLWTVVEAAIFFYRRTWPAASKTNASWPAHRLGRAGEVVYCREEKVGTRTVTFCLLPKGTHPRPQPAQPVGGPLRAFQCEGRRPGNK